MLVLGLAELVLSLGGFFIAREEEDARPLALFLLAFLLGNGATRIFTEIG